MALGLAGDLRFMVPTPAGTSRQSLTLDCHKKSNKNSPTRLKCAFND